MTDAAAIEDRIKSYLLAEVLPGEDPANLTAATPLITSGVLDSIATLKLVAFLEESFSISLKASETDAEHLDTIDRIVRLVQSKS